MSEENEEVKEQKHNGEYINDFLVDTLRYSKYYTYSDIKNRMSELAEFIKKYPDEVHHSLEKKSDYHNYLIEEVKSGVGEGGIACGPVSGPVVVSVKFNDGEKSQYLSCLEVEGFPYFYLTDKDIFKFLLDEEDDEDEESDDESEEEASDDDNCDSDSCGDDEACEDLDDDENEELSEFLENECLSSFEDINLSDHEYCEIYESIRESKDYNAAKLIRYILALVDLDFEATEALIDDSVNKHMSEFYVSRTRNEIWYDK